MYIELDFNAIDFDFFNFLFLYDLTNIAFLNVKCEMEPQNI